MQDLLVHNPVGLLEVDSTFIIKLANLEAERIFGYEAGGLAGKSINDLIPQASRARHHQHVAQFTQIGTSRMMGNSSSRQVFKALKKDGTTAHIQIGINLINRDQSTVYLIAVSDCDELHELTENLKKSNSELQTKIAELEELKHKKNHFMTVMSHELRTPLQSTLGLIELLHQDIDSQSLEQLLEDLNTCAFDMQRHVRTLTDYANSQQGNLELQTEECNLNSLIRAELERINNRFKNQKILRKEKLNLPEQVKHLTDPYRLASVLNGLLCNVYLHAQASEVEIHARLKNSGNGDQFCLEILDNGIGIASDIIEKMNQPFANFQSRKSNGQGGLGVGLYLNCQYVQAMQGKLTLKLRPEGGTQVILNLRLTRVAASTAPKEELLTSAPVRTISLDMNGNPLAGLSVLLVEDDKLIAKIARTLLQKAGSRVQVAHHGAEALEIVHSHTEHPFDLVLMDLDMPVMNGYDATRALRQLAEYARTPIVAVTAGIESDAFPKALAAGIDHCFSKPFKPSQLQAWLENAQRQK